MPPIGIASRSTSVKQTTTPKLWLMLVGVNQYQDDGLPSLSYSTVDCQGLAEALVNASAQFTQTEVKIYHDFAPQPPSLENIRASLRQITTAAQPIDTILFYFSGHGIVEPNAQQAFLCLADTHKSDLQNTALALQEILLLLGNSGVQNQLVWLDACHSGGMTLRGTTIEPLLNATPKMVELLQQRAAKSKGFYALLSCDTNQQSWEFPELGHGVFTYYLMKGLQGEAADSQGLIYVDNLYRYVYHQTLQYIDKSNQQLRLINQQKKTKGETQLFREYPLQTPKRIVEGVGELIVGKRLTQATIGVHRRIGIVVEGLLVSKTTLDISKFLGSAGDFALEYLPATKVSANRIKEAIARHLQQPASEVILLYLRGRIEETDAGEWLLLGENIRIKRSWLKQQLRLCTAQQIIILDCPVANTSLQDWVEDLQIDSHQGQCLIAYASPADAPERFAQKFLDTLMAATHTDGLSAAGAIAQLQLSLAGSGVPLYIWLSGTQGIIEILQAKTGANTPKSTTGLDLGVCPYMGLSAFLEEDSQYFYGREALTQQLIHQLRDRSFLAVIGASGSGKSSIVQAGVIPQLRLGKQIPSSEQWWIGSIRPGANPLEALARRLGGGGRGQGRQTIQNSKFKIQNEESILLPSADARGLANATLSCLLPPASPHLLLEGIFHQGVEGFVYWIRNQPHRVVVLVVDQFEEIFTLAPTPDRELFLELLLGAVQYAGDRFKLIITLRADFIASCLEVPALAKALQDLSVLVPPKLSLDDYRRMILNPAQQVGLKVEPELVEVLLRELNHSPGDLPLLEFVLEQLWQHRVAGELTLQTYQEQLGGIQGALERSSQAVYESFDSQMQECAKWIFLSLTQLGEGTEDTRRRVHKSELIVKKYPAALVEKTLNALTAAKLVVMNLEEEVTKGQSRQGEPENISPPAPPASPAPRSLSVAEVLLPYSPSPITVEVAHEILIRHWSTLRWWLEENRDRLRKQRQIEQASQLWLQRSQQADFLLQGVRLAEAEDIYIKYTDELSADVQRFIEACLVQRKQQQQQEKTRLKQAQRAVVALSILGLAAVCFGSLAYWKSQAAQLREIEALNASSQANLLSHQQLEALIASVKAGKQLKNTFVAPADLQTQTLGVLQQVISGTQERNRLEGHSAEVSSVSFSPDGKTIVSASNDKTAIIWGRDGTKLRTLTGHTDIVRNVSFSPDGQTIATASFDRTVKLWRTSDGGLIRTLKGHTAEVLSLSWSGNGETIATGSADRTAKIWQVSDGHLLRTFSGYKDFVNSVSFSPDGEILAIASADKTVKLWRVSDGLLQKTLLGHSAGVSSVAFSPDGQIASASVDKTVRLWRRDGTLLKIIPAHNAAVLSVNFSHDGQTLASTSADSTIKLWSSQDGSLRQTLLGHSIAVYSASFSPDDQTLVSAGADKTVRLWQRDNPLFKTLIGSQGQLYSVSFSPDGQIATAGQDTTIKLWQRDGTLRQTLEGYNTSIYGHSDEVYGLAFSPDGETLASASLDHYIKLWRTRDGYMIKTLQGHRSNVNSLSFSPNSQILASASADMTIKLWNIQQKALIKTLQGHTAEVLSVRFSPDGQVLASSGRDNKVLLWRVKDGKLLYNLPGHTNAVNAISFSPDGQVLASASADKTIKLWQVSNGTLLQTLTGHTDAIYSVSFSPDGKIIASASGDGSIKLWNREGRELKTLPGHTDAVLSLSFSPDGKFLASASFDGTAKLWRLQSTELQTQDLNNLLIRSCKLLKDYLKTNPNISDQERGWLCSDLRS
ncbi:MULTISPECIES: caspase family protein [unclassified Nostoc]|uniref:nSTAND1 domain-containing NTPase n=1 Tax=unclassified Nostoc TaxID=2593658 RepID=UPI002AD38489|nr:caspase family protein [Nostoc sp. DedQUE03]MDZ7975976.1 caspase family protein [Nostoc sp. DedQUE03]MDZ8044811.1 caspase family protein [Nostoc sp. DedQUE02]